MDERESLEKWQNACKLLDDCHYEESRKEFEEILNNHNNNNNAGSSIPRSKMFFNIGSIYMSQKRYDDAIKALSEATKIDTTLCIAYHQLAVAFTLQKRYKEALVNFQHAFNCVHERSRCINYFPLGLDYRYYAFEALLGATLCHQHLGNLPLARETVEASKRLCERHLSSNCGEMRELIKATDILQRGQMLQVRNLPDACIFTLTKSQKERIQISHTSIAPPPKKIVSASPVPGSSSPSSQQTRRPTTPPQPRTAHPSTPPRPRPAPPSTPPSTPPQPRSLHNSCGGGKPACSNAESPSFFRRLFNASPIAGVLSQGSEQAAQSKFYVTRKQKQKEETQEESVDHTECYITLRKHTTEDDGYLSFSANEHVELVNPVNENWIEGRIQEEKGLVPKNYLRKCPRSIN